MREAKRCTGCGETKPCEEFHKNKTQDGGFDIWCKSCKRTAEARRHPPQEASNVREKQFGQVFISVGTRRRLGGKDAICPVCRDTVLHGTASVLIDALGERKREYHAACFAQMLRFFQESLPEVAGQGLDKRF